MKVAGFLLVVLIFVTFVPHPAAASATNIVRISGYVHDSNGDPVKDVYVIIFPLTPPWESKASVTTNSKGYYAFSLDRPSRLDFPVFYKGRPVYEGYSMHAGSPVNERWMVMIDTSSIIDTENKDVIRKDFVLESAAIVKLEVYTSDGTLITNFMPLGGINLPWDDPMYRIYTSDLDWRTMRSVFIREHGILLVQLNKPIVLNLPWDVPGFGRVILRADNGGRGFLFTRPGDQVTINVNYEISRTEFRLLNESYKKYLDEGYVFSDPIPMNIQFAYELLQKASYLTYDSQKAHFADLSLNKTLWTAENMELEKANQDIKRYRKGDATLRIIDENGKPIQSADVRIIQSSHDFLFGTIGAPDQYNNKLMEAGINYLWCGFEWSYAEPQLGQYNFSALPSIDDLQYERNRGIRLGGEGLIMLEPGLGMWATGLLELSFDQLKSKFYEHVSKIVSRYSEYIDYWIVIYVPNYVGHSIGFTREQIIELTETAIEAIREADPTSQMAIFFDHPCSYSVGVPEGSDDNFTTDPYTFFSYIKEHCDEEFGISFWMTYGSVFEEVEPVKLAVAETYGRGRATPYSFRDLASISRLLDWYGTLNVPMYIHSFSASTNYTSPLGYWHRRSWDDYLQAEWIEKFYTIAFSKKNMKEITYVLDPLTGKMTSDRGLLSWDDANQSCVPRQSFYTLKSLITEKWTTRLETETDVNGEVHFRGFAGNYNITVRDKGLAKNFTIHVFEGESNAYQIRFDRNELLKEMKADAQSVLQELDRIRQWLETVNKVKSDEMLNTINNLTRLYEEGQYDQVIELGRVLTENPLEIQLNGRASDLEGFTVLRDQENDVALGSPAGTDIKEVYALADSSNLYIGIRVYGDRPNENATFHVEFETDSGRFHVFVRRVDTSHQCGCIQMPEVEGNIRFECAYAIGEIVEMQVPLLKLKSPMTIHVTNAWIWQESPRQMFDSYEGPPVEIPNLRSFKPATTLEIEKTETTYTTAITISPLIETSLPYIAAVSTVIILSVVIYWRKRRVRLG